MRLTAHFSERIPVVKRRLSVFQPLPYFSTVVQEQHNEYNQDSVHVVTRVFFLSPRFSFLSRFFTGVFISLAHVTFFR